MVVVVVMVGMVVIDRLNPSERKRAGESVGQDVVVVMLSWLSKRVPIFLERLDPQIFNVVFKEE